MVAFIFICCLLNLAAGIFLVVMSKTTAQEISGSICLLISSIFFIGGSIVYKLDTLITEVRKEKK